MSKSLTKPLQTPSTKTLAKYGLREIDFKLQSLVQGGVCAICKKLPASGRLMIDHEHLPGWKKLPDTERRKTVRGLLCFRDNYHFTARGMTLDRAKNLVQYLASYEATKKVGTE